MFKRLLAFLFVCQLALPAFAQLYPPTLPDPNRNQDSIPYKLTDIMPPFNILLKDSATLINSFNIPKGKYVALVSFSPDCSHCDNFTEKLLRGMDSLKHIQFYFLSTNPYTTEIQKFYVRHHLDKYKNIKAVGWDKEFFFLYHFGTMQIPDVALYNKNKKFVHLFKNEISVKELYEHSRTD